MLACPVCEHQQPAGSECEVCGRRLEAGRGTDAPVPGLEGLERTGLDGVGEVATEGVPGLEPTTLVDAGGGLLDDLAALGATGAPAAGFGLELEPTGAAPVEVAVEAVPDLERGGAEGLPDDAPTPLPLVVICRYCRTEAQPGEKRCGRCGMRLPAAVSSAPVPAQAAPTLCSCGAPVTRSRCPACGARHASA